jgi:hypothetical protein
MTETIAQGVTITKEGQTAPLAVSSSPSTSDRTTPPRTACSG